jgi:hypothetical protein
MPLLKGKANIGPNIETEEKTHPKAQAVAIALKTAGVPKAKDNMVTQPNGGMPAYVPAEDGSFSFGDIWPGG